MDCSLGSLHWYPGKPPLSQIPENVSHLWQGGPVQNPIYSLVETSGTWIYKERAQGVQFVAYKVKFKSMTSSKGY